MKMEGKGVGRFWNVRGCLIGQSRGSREHMALSWWEAGRGAVSPREKPGSQKGGEDS